MIQTFASLRYVNYRLWFTAAMVANIGTWMQRVAQDWLVLTVLSDNSGLAVGIVTALQFIPALVLSPLAGLAADRFHRKRMLMLTQSAMGVLAFGLGALVLSGQAQLWHVFGFALALGVVTAFDAPVRQIFVAELVPSDQVPNAVGLNSASFNAARLIGPGAAGLLIAAVGPGWAFIVNGVSFGATIVAMVLMRREAFFELVRAERARGQILEGVRYLTGRTDLLVIVVVVGFAAMFAMNFQLTSGVMARNEFGLGAGEYGLLGSILAIGSLGGALLAARRQRPRVRLVVGSALALGVFSGVLALMPTYLTFALLCAPVGFCSLTMLTSANATIQTTTTPSMRGRVLSLYMMVLMGGNPIGAPLVGWVAGAWGPRWSIGLGAIIATVVACAAILWTHRRWQYRVVYRRESRPRLQLQYAPQPQHV